MTGRRGRVALTIAAAAVVAFFVSGGWAAAKRMISGKEIASGAIGSRHLANGSVSRAKLSRGLRRLIAKSGQRGPTGTTGPQGPKGDPGQRGPAGAFDVVDAQGRRVGVFAGWFNTDATEAVMEVYTAGGAILLYSGNLSSDAPVIWANTAYYEQPGCVGTPYGAYDSTAPFQIGFVIDSPPVAGANVYVKTPGVPHGITYSSTKSVGWCSAASGSEAQAFPLQRAGTVPVAQKPLSLVPAS